MIKKRLRSKRSHRDDANVIRVKFNPNGHSAINPEKYNPLLNAQTQYALKCLTEDGHDELTFMARGLAIQRGFSLATEVSEQLSKKLGVDSDELPKKFKCDFGFQNPKVFQKPAQRFTETQRVEADTYLTPDCRFFAKLPDSCEARMT